MKKLPMQPLEDYVLIRQAKASETTLGGIVLPTVAQKKDGKGEVLAVGPGRRLETGERAKLQVAVGDTVLFMQYAGVEIKEQGEEYLLVRESDILARLK